MTPLRGKIEYTDKGQFTAQERHVLDLDPETIYAKIEGQLSVWYRKQGVTLKHLLKNDIPGPAGIPKIINGDTIYIKNLLVKIHGDICSKCGNDKTVADHIVAVCNGGGGCWLNNYQLLCRNCHNYKTRDDSKKSLKKRRTDKGESNLKVERIELKVEPSWKRRAVEAAARSNRSLSNYIEVVLTQKMDHLEKIEHLKWLNS